MSRKLLALLTALLLLLALATYVYYRRTLAAVPVDPYALVPDDAVLVRGGWRVDIDELWAQAGVRPEDVGFVQSYDDYPVIVMMQFEDLGFCAKGEGPAFVREHGLTSAGSLPANTSGGQLSAGQAGAAGGFLGMTEAIRQLTDAAGVRSVADAKFGLVSGFGMVTYDRCLCTGAVVLGRPS